MNRPSATLPSRTGRRLGPLSRQVLTKNVIRLLFLQIDCFIQLFSDIQHRGLDILQNISIGQWEECLLDFKEIYKLSYKLPAHIKAATNSNTPTRCELLGIITRVSQFICLHIQLSKSECNKSLSSIYTNTRAPNTHPPTRHLKVHSLLQAPYIYKLISTPLPHRRYIKPPRTDRQGRQGILVMTNILLLNCLNPIERDG